MSRKTGKDVQLQIEVGSTFYPIQALTATTTGTNAYKKYKMSTTFVSAREDLEPVVRLDGVISGGEITGDAARDNAVDVAAFTAYVKGVELSVAAIEVRNLVRPASTGNVVINAIVCDENGVVSNVAGTEGAAGGARGAAGGMPYIPTDSILLGYVTLSDVYASGSSTISATEINTEARERSDIPTYKINFHDDDADQGVGVVELGSALTAIHGAGANYRNVYASWYEPTFEIFPDCYDLELPEEISEITSRAYGDTYQEVATDIPSWSGSFNFYFTKVKDIVDIVKNSLRWMKFFPDKDDTQYWAGTAIVNPTHSFPVGDNMNGTMNLSGSRKLFAFRS